MPLRQAVKHSDGPTNSEALRQELLNLAQNGERLQLANARPFRLPKRHMFNGRFITILFKEYPKRPAMI